MNSKLIILTNDQNKIELNSDQIKDFSLINHLLSDIENITEIPLPFNSEIFSIILNYQNKYYNPQKNNWEDLFFQSNIKFLNELLRASNILGFFILSNSINKYISLKIMESNTPAEICTKFNINPNLNHVESSQILEKFKWTKE